MSGPSLAVVIAAHDHERYIGAALDSVLAQRRPADEVIVVDDGSTDGTAGVVAELGSSIVLMRTAHRGAAAARNHGWRRSTSELVAFLDADDEWLEEKLERQIAEHEAHPEAGLVYSDTLRVDPAGAPIDRWSEHFPPVRGGAFAAMLLLNRVQTSTVVMPRTVLESLGGFDERLSAWEDIDLWLRVARSRPFAHVPEVLARYRMGSGLSTRAVAMASGELASVRAATRDGQVPERLARLARARAKAHLGVAHYLEGSDRLARRWIRGAWLEAPATLLAERTAATYLKSLLGRRRLRTLARRPPLAAGGIR